MAKKRYFFHVFRLKYIIYVGLQNLSYEFLNCHREIWKVEQGFFTKFLAYFDDFSKYLFTGDSILGFFTNNFRCCINIPIITLTKNPLQKNFPSRHALQFSTVSIISTAYLHSFLRYIILLLQYPGGDAFGWQVLLFHWLVLKLVKSCRN